MGLLTGKTAVITGASRGIGKAIALLFAQEGADIAITNIADDDEFRNAVKEIESLGVKTKGYVGNAASFADSQKVINNILTDFTRIDILVNNAGASPAMASVLDSDERLWDTIMNLNLKGVYFTSQAVAKIMKKQGGGKIINVASVDGFKPEPGVSVYSISKAGCRMITKSFAMELAGANIQVNTIAPGPIDTKMMNSHWFHMSPEEAKKAREILEKSLPTGRIGKPEEIAGAAVYLASEASNYTTGTEIIIDGGILLGNLLVAEK